MSQATAQVSTVVNASSKQVWHALTDPALIREYYMGADVSTDWKVGSPITFTGEWNGKTYEDKGEILEVRPDEELRYSHWSPTGGTDDAPENYHVIDIVLRAENGGTEVTLTQSNSSGDITDADREARRDYETNWTTMLDGLKKTVESSTTSRT